MAELPVLEMQAGDQDNTVVARDVAGRQHINLQHKRSAGYHRLVVVIHIRTPYSQKVPYASHWGCIIGGLFSCR